MTLLILFVIVVSYGAVQFFEITALFARIAGVNQKSALVGYSVQNAVYMITRFFLIALLPLLGLVVDLGIGRDAYAAMAHASLLCAATFGLLLVSQANKVLNYYAAVITKYKNTNSFFAAFFVRPHYKAAYQKVKLRNLLQQKVTRNLLSQAILVYLVYSTGLFVSFYLALIFSDFSTTISQMSGAVNALGAVLLTLYIEPKISRSIDERADNVTALVYCLIWGRILATGVFGQILLLTLFKFT